MTLERRMAGERGRGARRERGSALLISLLLMALLGAVGLASLDTVMRDRISAGNTTQSRQALYAADAGIAEGLSFIRTSTVGDALSPGECLSGSVGSASLANGASYAQSAGTGVCMLASANPCANVDGSIELGGQIFLNTIWEVRMEGTSVAGAEAEVQATVTRCHPFDN